MRVRPGEEEQWPEHLVEAVRQRMKEPGHTHPPSLRLLGANQGGNRIELEMRFKSGVRYCCGEYGCHIGFYSPSWWEAVRAELAEVSDRIPPRLVLKVNAVIEDGALFANLAQIGLSERSEAYSYEVVVKEGD